MVKRLDKNSTSIQVYTLVTNLKGCYKYLAKSTGLQVTISNFRKQGELNPYYLIKGRSTSQHNFNKHAA